MRKGEGCAGSIARIICMEEFKGKRCRKRLSQSCTVYRSAVSVRNSTLINDAGFPGAVGSGFKIVARVLCDGLIARVTLRDETHNVDGVLSG